MPPADRELTPPASELEPEVASESSSEPRERVLDAALEPQEVRSTETTQGQKDDRGETSLSSEAESISTREEPITVGEPAVERDSEVLAPDVAETVVDGPHPAEEEDGDFPEVFSFSEDSGQRTHWASSGAFIGVASRPSGTQRIRYKPGIARGVFLEPQLVSWLGVRLFVRWEDLPVEVRPGAFDTSTENHDFEFEQSDLDGFSMGLRLEPSYRFNKYLSVLGVLHWSWYRFEAEAPSASEFSIQADRQGTELNWGLGAGISFEVIPGWIDWNVAGTYSLVSAQSGSAYDEIQVIVAGQITHLAALPRSGSSMDVLTHLGLIF